MRKQNLLTKEEHQDQKTRGRKKPDIQDVDFEEYKYAKGGLVVEVSDKNRISSRNLLSLENFMEQENYSGNKPKKNPPYDYEIDLDDRGNLKSITITKGKNRKDLKEYLKLHNRSIAQTYFAKGGRLDSHDIASQFMDYKYDGHDWWEGDSYKDELAEGRYLGAVQLVELRQGKGDDIELISNLDDLDRDVIDEIMSSKRYAKGGKLKPIGTYSVYALVDGFDEAKQDYDQVYYKTDDYDEIIYYIADLKNEGEYTTDMQLIEVMPNGKMRKFNSSMLAKGGFIIRGYNKDNNPDVFVRSAETRKEAEKKAKEYKKEKGIVRVVIEEEFAKGGDIPAKIKLYQNKKGNHTVVVGGSVFEMGNNLVGKYIGELADFPSDVSHWGKSN